MRVNAYAFKLEREVHTSRYVTEQKSRSVTNDDNQRHCGKSISNSNNQTTTLHHSTIP